MKGRTNIQRGREYVSVGDEVRGGFRVDGKEKKKTNRSKTEQRKMNDTFKCSQLFFFDKQ